MPHKPDIFIRTDNVIVPYKIADSLRMLIAVLLKHHFFNRTDSVDTSCTVGIPYIEEMVLYEIDEHHDVNTKKIAGSLNENFTP